MSQTRKRVFPDADYPQRLNALWTAIEAARRDEEKAPPELYAGEELPSVELAEEYQALKDEADQDAETKNRVVELQGIGRRDWRKLKEKYPPRSGDDADPEVVKGDRLAGLNTDEVADDLVHASLRKPEAFACASDQRVATEACSGDNPCGHRAAFALANTAAVDPKSLPSSVRLSSARS